MKASEKLREMSERINDDEMDGAVMYAIADHVERLEKIEAAVKHPAFEAIVRIKAHQMVCDINEGAVTGRAAEVWQKRIDVANAYLALVSPESKSAKEPQ